MPNHVTTRCIVTGPEDQIAQFRDLMIHLEPRTNYRGEPQESEMIFDCGRIIPMPEILKGPESGTTAEYGAELILMRSQQRSVFNQRQTISPVWIERFRKETGMPSERLDLVAAAYLKLHPEFEAAGRRRLQAILETGYPDWYEWSVKNWGTKWNAYRFIEISDQPGHFEFSFQTAWSFPTPVFEQLASHLPMLAFDCACFDEGWGFAGQGFFRQLYTSQTHTH